MKYFIILFSLYSFIFMQTEVSGSVNGNWTVQNSPYIATNNLVLQPSDTLTISPGVEIKFDGEFRFDIFGTFFAIGNESDSIKFTSNTGGNWMSINFADFANDNSTMQYCVVEYASDSGYEPFWGAINCYNSSPTILNSRISHGLNYGITLDHSHSIIESNYFSDIGNYGINSNFADSSQILNNTLINVQQGIYLTSTTAANVSSNQLTPDGAYGIRVYNNCNQIEISSNSINNSNSAGIKIDNSNYDILISLNSIIDNSGDGISINYNNINTLITSNSISGNVYGIYINQNNSNVQITNNVISSNAADGIRFQNGDNANMSIQFNIISSNDQGGIIVNNSYNNFGNFIENIVSSNGNRGMYIWVSGGSSFILNNTIFNHPDDGLYLYHNSSSNQFTKVINNSITNNLTGIEFDSGTIYNIISNNNSWNNTNGNYTGYLPNGTGNLTNINPNGTVCDIYFNISESPQYIDPENLDFNLQPNSPNIDAGDPAYIDLDGTISDIGALPLLQEVPAFSISPSEINFGNVNLGEIDTISVIITSTGTVDLLVTGLQIDGEGFSVMDDNFELSNGEQYSFEVFFEPTENISYSGVFTIYSNSPANPEFEIPVFGSAFEIYNGPTYYVGTNGNDTNNGSMEMPFASIQTAVNMASDGDTIRISPGYYQESNIDIEYAINIFGSEIDSTVIDANWESYLFNYNYNIQDTVMISDILFENGYSDSLQSAGINFISDSGGLIISNCTFNNNSVYGNGVKAGAIYSNGYIKCTNSTFTSNSGNTGAIYSYGYIECTNSTFTSNSGYGDQWNGNAAAIFLRKGGVISNCIFTDNNYDNAVRIINFGDILLENSTFYNNSSGAIAIESIQNAKISKVRAWQNTADYGAFLNLNNCENVIIDSIIANNNYASQKGGALYVSGSNCEINKSDIIYNSAYEEGGGIYIYNQTELPRIHNTILWGNTSGGISNQIINANGVLDVSYCDIQGGYDGNNNIDSYPMFLDILNMDFNLQSESLCINAGDPLSQYDPDSSITDIGRFHFSISDFGDEFRITSIVDVPEDNGGQVIISWHRSIYDGLLILYYISHYSIWRWNETADDLPEYSQYLRDGWEYIGDSPAQEFEDYSYIAPTLLDSTDSGLPMTSFLIVAHTIDPDIFFVSEPDSGYSVDNLPPSIPTDLVISEFGAIYSIEWMPPDDIDISFYSIFRDGILSDNTSNNYYTDTETEYGGIYSYQLSAHDIHNNQSQLSEPLTAVSGFLGDANGDQNIDVLDVVLIVGIILESEIPEIYESWVSDLNRDSIIDVLDIVQLVAIILDSVEVNNSNSNHMKVRQSKKYDIPRFSRHRSSCTPIIGGNDNAIYHLFPHGSPFLLEE